MTDALAVLSEDHRKVEQLFLRFEQLRESPEVDTKLALVREIIHELSVHAGIEEQVFYPSVRRALPQGDRLAEGLLHEHQEVEELLAELEKMDPTDERLVPLVMEVMHSVKEHVAEEEGQVFPKVREAIAPETLEQMGEALQNAKRFSPTRPHPHAPSTPPANQVAGPVAGAVDRMAESRGRRMLAMTAGAAAVGFLVWRAIRGKAA